MLLLRQHCFLPRQCFAQLQITLHQYVCDYPALPQANIHNFVLMLENPFWFTTASAADIHKNTPIIFCTLSNSSVKVTQQLWTILNHPIPAGTENTRRKNIPLSRNVEVLQLFSMGNNLSFTIHLHVLPSVSQRFRCYLEKIQNQNFSLARTKGSRSSKNL